MNHPDKQNINHGNLPAQQTKQNLISFYQLKNHKKSYPETSQFSIPHRKQSAWQERIMRISERQRAVEMKLSNLLNDQKKQYSHTQRLLRERIKELDKHREYQKNVQTECQIPKQKAQNFSRNQQDPNIMNVVNYGMIPLSIVKSGQPTNLNSLNNSFNLQASMGSTLKQYLYEKSVRQDQNQVHEMINQILKLVCILNRQKLPQLQQKQMNQLQALNFIKKQIVNYLLSLQALQINQSSDQIEQENDRA